MKRILLVANNSSVSMDLAGSFAKKYSKDNVILIDAVNYSTFALFNFDSVNQYDAIIVTDFLSVSKSLSKEYFSGNSIVGKLSIFGYQKNIFLSVFGNKFDKNDFNEGEELCKFSTDNIHIVKEHYWNSFPAIIKLVLSTK